MIGMADDENKVAGLRKTLKKIRGGLTQPEMAARIGITRDAYQKIEQRESIRTHHLQRISEEFGIPVEDILVDTTRVDPGADSIFLLDDGELKVKRVQRDPRNGMLVIKSDNPHYEDFSDVPPENVRIVGRVFWVGRHF